jgi:hypothetical protein
MDVGGIHAAAWLFHRRYSAAVPRPTPFYECVSCFLGTTPLTNVVSAVWPANLVTCALFNTLHAKSYVGMGTREGVSRKRFFLYAGAASMCWYFVPGYLFQALSYFSWVCWIAPDNIIVNQLFGYVSGLGMSTITFDWAQIAFMGEHVVEWNQFTDGLIEFR